MKHSWIWKLLASFALFGLAIYVLIPTFVYFSLDEHQLKEVRKNKGAFANYLPSWAIQRHIVPGLDLQGGIHLALGVDVDKAIGDRTSRVADRVQAMAKEKNVPVKSVTTEGDRQNTVIKVTFANNKDLNAFLDAKLDEMNELQRVSETDSSLSFQLDPASTAVMRRDAVDQTIHNIRNRIDSMGVTEPTIAKRGTDQIQIQLPGYDDPDNAKSLIGRTGQLEFQMCDDQNEFLKNLKDLPEGVKLQESGYRGKSGAGDDIFLLFAASDLNKVKEYLKGKVPEGDVVKFGKLEGGSMKGMMRSYTLFRKVDLTGDDLVDARVTAASQFDSSPAVSMEFSTSGGKIFEEVSGANVGRRFAIVLEDNVDSTPVFESKIAGGRAQITLGKGKPREQVEREARDLALVLKSGALPAPVTFREERSVGPTLGQDSVENALKAFWVGGLLIILFMIFYYRVAGIISVLGVTFNVVFILAAMAWIGATITLPGVAGLLLTIGMAVDTNVIINERIREELRRGKMPRSAVKAGYSAAFSAVIDSHVTTFIGGIVLWNFGTGPVQNFAATILIGTVFSIFTGVVITRIFFEALTHKGPKTISI
jgi:protein-export membrane protein SecD